MVKWLETEELGYFWSGEELTWWGIIAAFKHMKEKLHLFYLTSESRTRSNGQEFQRGRFRLDVRKTFLTIRVMQKWNGLPLEGVPSSSLGVIKQRFHDDLRATMWRSFSIKEIICTSWTRWSLISFPFLKLWDSENCFSWCSLSFKSAIPQCCPYIYLLSFISA